MTNDKTHIVAVRLTDRYFRALEEMAIAKDISPEQCMIQGLRLLQLFDAGKLTVNDDGPSKTLGEHDAGCQMRFPPFNHCTCAKSVAELTADVPFKNMPPAERAKLRPANYAMLPSNEQWDIDKRLGLLDWEGIAATKIGTTCNECGVDCAVDLYIVRGMTLCPGCAKTEIGEQFFSLGKTTVPCTGPDCPYCVEPHLVSLHRWYHSIWWRLRGVGPRDFRAICKHCGRTGQAHWDWRGCWRFSRVRSEAQRGC